MKRQFEKVLNDFQPGLLQSLQATNADEDDRDSQVSLLRPNSIEKHSTYLF